MRCGHPAPASDLCNQEMAWSQHEVQSQSMPAFWSPSQLRTAIKRLLRFKISSRFRVCTVFCHVAWTADCVAGMADYELALSLSPSCVHLGHGILPTHDRPD